jgi:hypothetical protein
MIIDFYIAVKFDISRVFVHETSFIPFGTERLKLNPEKIYRGH